mgnify:CR=1 FL=1
MEITKLARCIKNLRGKQSNSFIIGIVKSLDPLLITISGIDFARDEYSVNASLTGDLTYNYFKVGDKALFLESNGELILFFKVV